MSVTENISNPESESVSRPEARPRRRASAGKYVVLKAVGDSDSWLVVSDSVESKDSASAVRAVAVTEDKIIEGRYVAVPAASFKPRVVRQVVHVSMD